MIPITDPTTHTPFPNNVIPSSRLDPNGIKVLNLFPLPNYTNRAITGGSYNYQYQEITNQPKYTEDIKTDYNPTAKDRFSLRLAQFTSNRQGYQSLAAFNSNWPELRWFYFWPTHSINLNYTRIFTPTILNEYSIGYHDSAERGVPSSPDAFSSVSRQTLGLNIPQFTPSLNPYNVIPRILVRRGFCRSEHQLR